MLIQGKSQIARYIGESSGDWIRLRKLGLPVYRERVGGKWKARRADLDKWIDWRAEYLLANPPDEDKIKETSHGK